MHQSGSVSVLIVLAAALLVMASCDKVRDPRPGTLRLSTYEAGRPQTCLGKLFNADGVQLQEFAINDGRVSVDKLNAGSYTLKFSGLAGKVYRAEVEFRLFEAGEVDLEVDLDKDGQAALRRTGAAASRAKDAAS